MEAAGAPGASAGDAVLQSTRLRRQLSFARRGLVCGLLSGVTWGIVGVLLGLALGLPPFSDASAGSAALWGLLAAPLVGACLHDTFAALWLIAFNVGSGRGREYARTLVTSPRIGHFCVQRQVHKVRTPECRRDAVRLCRVGQSGSRPTT